jgi:hypothetical protein
MVGADHADQQPEQARDQSLQGVLRGDHRDQRDAEQHHHHHLHRAQVEPDLRQPGQQRERGERGDEPAEHRRGKGQHDGLLRLALLRHRVAVERGGGGAARARDLDQDRRHAAGEVVRAVQRHHEGERVVHRDAERERQQHDERVLRAEPGQDSHHDAEHDTEPDDPPQRELRCELAGDELPAQEKSCSIGPCGKPASRTRMNSR